MSNTKMLSALCYFSIFFFPLLIPFVIYFASAEQEVKFHAKRSFISHIIPTLLLIIGAIFFYFSLLSADQRMLSLLNQQFDFWTIFPFIFTFLYSALFIGIFVWNIFQGVKVLK